MIRRMLPGVVAVVMAVGTITAQDTADRVSVPFSDPSRPGTLKVNLISGSITVKASSTRQVVVSSSARDDRGRAPANSAGLRRLTSPGSLNIVEEANVMTIRAAANRQVDLEIEVPTRTNLSLNSTRDGAIVVEGVDGNLEVDNTNGPITLTSVSGSVVANALNDNVIVTMSRVAPDKPMSFSSLNGEVDVTLPPSTKAQLKLRSDMGDVFTDFDVRMTPAPAPTVNDTRKTSGRYRLETNKAIYGTINGGGPEIEIRTFNGDVYLRRGK